MSLDKQPVSRVTLKLRTKTGKMQILTKKRSLPSMSHRFLSSLHAISLSKVDVLKKRLSVLFLLSGVIYFTSLQAAENAENQAIQVQADARQLFQNFQDRLYQIRTIDKASGSKASIGSGFSISHDGKLITNYHVVSQYILHPEKYHLEALDHNNQTHSLEVLQIDVINDLALIRLLDVELTPWLELAMEQPQKGEQIYSLGNPKDLGMTVVPGTFNGRATHSYYDRILFSGSINPGMSGGPVIDRFGKVIGVNVATSGNQISFLVPLSKLQKLLKTSDENNLALQQQAYQQLKLNQQQLMTHLFNGQWTTVPLGEARVIGEITEFISCWGESEQRKEEQFSEVYRRCRNSEYIYIAPDFYTGIIEMEFFWYQTSKLTDWQFYKMLSDSFSGASAGNVAGEEHVTEYQCTTDFIQKEQSEKLFKAVYCVREYKQFPGLYDVLYLSASIGPETKSLVSHYTLSGVEQQQAQEFLRRFMEHLE
jgi:S1-C subfamily serine protease